MKPLDKKTPLTLIGLMSGTSVDAIDACCVKIWQPQSDGQLSYDILGTHTHAMPNHIRQRLLNCMGNQPVALKELSSLDSVMGILFAEAVYGLLNSTKLDRNDITAIASHGQTVFHNPPRGQGVVGSTLQIGNASVIAEHIGIPVINDFRSRDMAVGGHGAPLVCFADQVLFQDDTLGRCIQNIGGIANVTVLPPSKAPDTADIFAFDTGPGNMMIDGAMQALFNQPYDDGGQIAASGHLDQSMLTCLLDNPYFNEAPPKSTGRELFGSTYLEQVLAQFSNTPKENILATLTYFTARTIADAYQQFVFPKAAIQEVILGGGGVHNLTLRQFLADALSAQDKAITLKTHQDFGIPDQYKEALAFAMLGWARLTGTPGNIPTCTGATRPVVLGQIAF